MTETPLRTRESPPSAGYAELHAHSSFSFLDGASSPEELVDEACRLGVSALALTDHDGMSGVVRFAGAARDAGLPTIFGAELGVDVALPSTKSERAIAARAGVPDPPGRHLLVLARDPAGYASLCRVISRAQLRGGAKGRPQYNWDGLAEAADGHWLVLTGCRKGPVRAALEAGKLGTVALDPARAALAESWLTVSAATMSRSSSPTPANRWPSNATKHCLCSPVRLGCRWWRRPRRTTTLRRAAGWPR
jgi:DNA polymerase III alpha subunit